MERSPDAVLALISGLDVVNNFAFAPHRRAEANGLGTWDATPIVTLCNCYVTCCTAALGCAIAPMLANRQHDWLLSPEGQLAGWMHVDSETARQRAQSGYPTVASLANPGGHGHIALVVPADPVGPPGLYVSSAGGQNYVRCLLARSFGDSTPDYFTHN
jgi:hypothetical protein